MIFQQLCGKLSTGHEAMGRLVLRMMRLLVNRRRWDLLLPLLAGPVAALLPGVGLGLAFFCAFLILFVRLLVDAAGHARIAEPLLCGLIAAGVVILRGSLLVGGPFLAVILGFGMALSDQHPFQHLNALLIALFAGGVLGAHMAPLVLLHALRRPLARALGLDEAGRPLAASCLVLALLLAACALGAISIWLSFGEAGFAPAMLLLLAVEAATWALYAAAATPDSEAATR